ncbi:MAG TPA: zinc-ribbon domain-containing protein [Chloroflexi bacterium]|nr:zinc-ribbon domain-containing protein [Chloroflexota bacterium]
MAQGDVPSEKEDRPVSMLVDCPRCGQSNPMGERYCVNCGASLAGVEATPREPAEAGEKKGGVLNRLFGKRR